MTVQLTPAEIRDDVRVALVEEGHLPTDARAAVNMCGSAESFTELYSEALRKIRSMKPSAQDPAEAGNSVRKGDRGESPEPRAVAPSRAAARDKAATLGSDDSKPPFSDLVKAGMERAKAAGRIPGRPQRLVNRDAVMQLREDGKTIREISNVLSIPQAIVGRIVKTESERTNQAAPQAPEITTGEDSMDSKCQCSPNCPKTPNGPGRKFAWGHAPKAAASPKVDAPKKKKDALRKVSKPMPNWPDEKKDATVATLLFTEEQLNQMFLQSSLEQKAECIQTWMTRRAQAAL